jgi:hypothetical protein
MDFKISFLDFTDKSIPQQPVNFEQLKSKKNESKQSIMGKG